MINRNMEMLTELTTEYGSEPINLMEALEEAVGVMNARRNTKGGPIKATLKGAASFFKKNPGVTIAAATLALDTYSKYKANKRNTVKLFAKDAYERKMMTSVVDAMIKGGRFKVVKTRYAQGGRYWVLKRL